MTIKDWIYLGITVASYLLAIIAGVYAKDKAKINKTTKAVQGLDALDKLATNAVHEVEYIGGSSQEKREFASEIISQGLSWLGIKGITPNQVNGAIEKAVNAMNIANQDINSMNLANQDVKPAESEFAENVPEKDIVQPVAPTPVAPTKDVTINGK